MILCWFNAIWQRIMTKLAETYPATRNFYILRAILILLRVLSKKIAVKLLWLRLPVITSIFCRLSVICRHFRRVQMVFPTWRTLSLDWKAVVILRMILWHFVCSTVWWAAVVVSVLVVLAKACTHDCIPKYSIGKEAYLVTRNGSVPWKGVRFFLDWLSSDEI